MQADALRHNSHSHAAVWNKYKQVEGHGLQEFKYGHGWNIEKWPEDVKRRAREQFAEIDRFSRGEQARREICGPVSPSSMIRDL